MEKQRMDPQKARQLCKAIFIKVGMTPEHADIVADNLVFADLRGISSHGISRVKVYSDRAIKGYCNTAPQMKLLRETGGTLLLDGDNGYGAVVGKHAMELTLQRAREYGVAICSVCHSNHFGASAYYTMMAARQHMVGFCCTNSQPNMVPFGGKQPMMGTNPFSVAIPTGKEPALVLDIASSLVARGNILNAAKEGQPIPDGWAVDQDGRPTNDPNQALTGSVLPFGGHKGYGIAVIIDILCGILSGAAFGRHIRQLTEAGMQGAASPGPDVGHLFMAIDVSFLQEVPHFEARVSQLVSELKESERAPNVDEILLPGEIEHRKTEENLRLGISVGDGTFKELELLCQELGTEIRPAECLAR